MTPTMALLSSAIRISMFLSMAALTVPSLSGASFSSFPYREIPANDGYIGLTHCKTTDFLATVRTQETQFLALW